MKKFCRKEVHGGAGKQWDAVWIHSKKRKGGVSPGQPAGNLRGRFASGQPAGRGRVELLSGAPSHTTGAPAWRGAPSHTTGAPAWRGAPQRAGSPSDGHGHRLLEASAARPGREWPALGARGRPTISEAKDQIIRLRRQTRALQRKATEQNDYLQELECEAMEHDEYLDRLRASSRRTLGLR